MIIPSHDELKEVMHKAVDFEIEINDFLVKRDYAKIMDRFKQQEIKEILGRNQRIYILSIMIRLIVVEIEKSGKTTLEGRDTSQLIRLFRILTLYLRRIEFDFPYNLQNEIVNYIKQEKIGLPIVIGVIANNSVIIQKQKIFDSLGIWWRETYE